MHERTEHLGTLRVLLIDSDANSRQATAKLLRDCSNYSVHAVKTSKEALTLLAPAASGSVEPAFDIILKEHEGSASACRLLKQMARTELLAKVPVVGEREERSLRPAFAR